MKVFVNRTGRTVQELLDESKEKHRKGLIVGVHGRDYNLNTSRLWDDDAKKWYRMVTFFMENNASVGRLTDDDLSQLNPDEQIWHHQKNEYVRLGDLNIYKGALRRSKQPKVKKKKKVNGLWEWMDEIRHPKEKP
jgi:hypothetical protein